MKMAVVAVAALCFGTGLGWVLRGGAEAGEEKGAVPDPVLEARESWSGRNRDHGSPLFREEDWARAALADPSLDGAVFRVAGAWSATGAYFKPKEKRHRLAQVMPNLSLGRGALQVLMPELSVEGVRGFQGKEDFTGRVVIVEGVIKIVDGEAILVTFDPTPET